MFVLWMTLSSAYVCSLLSRYLARPTAIGPIYIQPNKFLVFVVGAIIVLVAGLRNNIGDTFFICIHTL